MILRVDPQEITLSTYSPRPIRIQSSRCPRASLVNVYFLSLCSISRILSLTQMYAKQTNSGKRSADRHLGGCEVGVTHLSTGVIIYLEGLSVRHPKGARSIGIGHPRSGDRCTKTLPYPLDPLWVAEQSLQRPRKGVAGLLALPAPHSSLLDEWLRCLSNASPLISETKAVVKRRKIGTFEIYERDGRGSYTGPAETARRVGGLR